MKLFTCFLSNRFINFTTHMLLSRLFLWSIVVLVAILFTWCDSTKTMAPQEAEEEIMPQVCAQDHCRNVEVADEVHEQQRGLMNRTHLDEDAGMLFVFPQLGSWQFWMKDTLIPLDMLWLDSAGRVLHIASDVPPCPLGDACPWYWPTEKRALYVLELNAGQVQEYGITTGAVLTLPTP